MKQFGVCLLCLACAACLVQGCATTAGKEVLSQARMFNRPYEQVWTALSDLLENDMMCVPKEVKKKKRHGVIETEWVHRIDTEGTLRWKIVAEVRQQSDGVLVLIDKKVQLRDQAKKNVDRYRREKKDTAGKTGWKNQKADVSSIETVYDALGRKLK